MDPCRDTRPPSDFQGDGAGSMIRPGQSGEPESNHFVLLIGRGRDGSVTGGRAGGSVRRARSPARCVRSARRASPVNIPSTHLSLIWALGEEGRREDAWAVFRACYGEVIVAWCLRRGLDWHGAEDLSQ